MSIVVPEQAPHLGGYVEGGDEATRFPHLWAWLARDLGIGSVLDIGCGDGVALRAFRKHRCVTVGVDGVAQDDRDIVCHDYTTGPLVVDRGRDFGLVWCCEFVEHVEERYVPNFVETFRQGRRVLMTHATPGQDGHHHVNCRTADYWIGVLAGAGFDLDEETTLLSRRLAAANPSPWNHFVRSGLAFRRTW